MILVTFLESFATILVARGIYFYNRHQLGFGDAENLSLIGMGFVLGPLVGLGATRLAEPLGGPMAGYFAGVGPLLLLCTVAALRAMTRKTS